MNPSGDLRNVPSDQEGRSNRVAMLIVLVPAADGDRALRPESTGALSELGVTHVSLLRDDEGLAVVLEGWAFDPEHSGDAVRRVVSRDEYSCRTLLPLAKVSLAGSVIGRKADRSQEGSGKAAPLASAPVKEREEPTT